MTEFAPPALEETISYAYPDFLGAEVWRHSDSCFTVLVLDLDQRYNTWRAHLSLDDRWTLSPVALFCDSPYLKA